MTAVWRAFSLAQLVLWATLVLLSRVMLLTDGDPASWVVVAGPAAVLLTLLTWLVLLWRAHSGLRPLRQGVRTDRLLAVGVAAQGLGLVTLVWATTLDPRGAAGTVGLLIAIGLVLVATGAVWLRGRRGSAPTQG